MSRSVAQCGVTGTSMLYLLVVLGIGLLISSAVESQLVPTGGTAGHVHASRDALRLLLTCVACQPSPLATYAGQYYDIAARFSWRGTSGRPPAEHRRACEHGGRAAASDAWSDP
jgi:hypothetical protein